MSAKFVPLLRVVRTAPRTAAAAAGSAPVLATSSGSCPGCPGVVHELTFLHGALWFARYTIARAVASFHMVAATGASA